MQEAKAAFLLIIFCKKLINQFFIVHFSVIIRAYIIVMREYPGRNIPIFFYKIILLDISRPIFQQTAEKLFVQFCDCTYPLIIIEPLGNNHTEQAWNLQQLVQLVILIFFIVFLFPYLCNDGFVLFQIHLFVSIIVCNPLDFITTSSPLSLRIQLNHSIYHRILLKLCHWSERGYRDFLFPEALSPQFIRYTHGSGGYNCFETIGIIFLHKSSHQFAKSVKLLPVISL